jgi:DNA invertase Pin-like site-specific DNA recombinase
MKIGYARVSTSLQDTALQLDALEKAGCERIYSESISGKDKNRQKLNEMINALRAGDIVLVWRLDRLGRSTKDLIELVDVFKSKDVQFVSLTESIDTTTATGQLIFGFFASMAQFERNLLSERTKAGIAAARKRGRVGGRKPKMTKKQAKLAQAMLLDSCVTKTEVASHFKVSRPTLDKMLRDLGEPEQRSLL